jgi:hypothetical protein
MKQIYMFLFVFVFMPGVALAQFTGFQDETVSVPSWSANSGYAGSQDTEIRNDNQRFGTEGSYTNSGVLNSSRSITCNVKTKTLNGYVDYFGCAVQVAVLPFVLGIAILSFVWGVTVMVRSPDNQEAQSKGRTFILWGIIGLFVITSVYALIAILRRTVGFGSNFGGRENSGTPYIQLKEKVQNLK